MLVYKNYELFIVILRAYACVLCAVHTPANIEARTGHWVSLTFFILYGYYCI